MTQAARSEDTEPRVGPASPARTWLTERQHLTGALQANAEATAETSEAPKAAAGTAGADDQPPARSSRPTDASDDPLVRIEQLVGKLADRVGKQSEFLTKLNTKVDATRQDLERRFSGRPQADTFDADRASRREEESDPGTERAEASGGMNARTAQAIAAFVREEMRKDIAPLVSQTIENTLQHRISQARQDPEIDQLVQELPAQVRANLAQQVRQAAGERLFAQSDDLFDQPDPVVEAIELIHYRTVVRAGKGRQTQSTNQPARDDDGRFVSPIPESGGTRAATRRTNADAQAASELFGSPVGKEKYPPAIARMLGIS